MIVSGKVINIRRFESNPAILSIELTTEPPDDVLEFNDVVSVITEGEVFYPESKVPEMGKRFVAIFDAIVAEHPKRSRTDVEARMVVSWCRECGTDWPCPTMAVILEAAEPSGSVFTAVEPAKDGEQ